MNCAAQKVSGLKWNCSMLLINTRRTLSSSRTVSYEEQAISYVWKNDEDTLRKSPSLTTLNAYLIKNATDVCDVKGNWRGEWREC